MSEHILPRSPEDFLGANHDRYVQLLHNPRVWRKVPLINYIPLHQLRKNNLLLRFRGMILDIKEPEMFLKSYTTTKKTQSGLQSVTCNGLYQEIYLCMENITIDLSSTSTETGQRRVLVVSTLPVINNWATNFERKFSNLAVENSPQVLSVMELDEIAEEAAPVKEAAYREILRMNMSTIYAKSFPIQKRSNQICWVKIYDDLDKYSVHSIIDVVGFYNLGPGHSALLTELSDEELECNLDVIPRLHAIAVHQLPHANPYLDIRFIPQDNHNDTLNSRRELMNLLKMYVFNDELAAEFLLLHLISTSLNHRSNDIIGKLTLNIDIHELSSVSSRYGQILYEIIRLLTVSSHFLSLNPDTLHDLSLMPVRDEILNKFKPGMLQMAQHTHLVLDETSLNDTQRPTEKAFFNLKCFGYLTKYQRIYFNHKTFRVRHDVDIPTIVISCGIGILPCDIIVPLRVTSAETDNSLLRHMKLAKNYLRKRERLNRFRTYLTRGKISKIVANSRVKKAMLDDFFKQPHPDNDATYEELRLLQTIARLHAISYGKHNIDLESWFWAKQKNVERLMRMRRSIAPPQNLMNALLRV